MYCYPYVGCTALGPEMRYYGHNPFPSASQLIKDALNVAKMMDSPSGKASFNGCASILSLVPNFFLVSLGAKNTLFHTCALIL